MRVSHVCERRQHAGRGASRSDVGAGDQRLAWSRAEAPPTPAGSRHVEASVEPVGGDAVRAGTATGEQDSSRPGQPFDQRLAPRDPSDHAASPATTVSRVACLATQKTVTAPAMAGPRTTATSATLASSGSVA